MNCPHCEKPLDRVCIFRDINDTETWERMPTGGWLRIEHEVECCDLDQYCAECGNSIGSKPEPGGLGH